MLKKFALSVVAFSGVAVLALAGDQISSDADLHCTCSFKLGTASPSGNGYFLDYDDKTSDNEDFTAVWDYGTNRYEDPNSNAYIDFDADSGTFVLVEPDGER